MADQLLTEPETGVASSPTPTVFVSYAREDAGFVQVLSARLEQSGETCWIDVASIPPTTEWWERIRAGIERARVFVAVLSPHSARSDVCRDELAHAVELGKRIVPVVCEDVSPDEV